MRMSLRSILTESPEYQSEINGTLVADGDDFILEAHGTAGSPYTYLE